MKDDPGKEDQPRKVTPLLGMAFIALLAHLASTELHESLHLVVGRLAGLPTHFFSLTSVGVTPSVAASASSSALALMNAVAPLATIVLGLLALAVVPTLRAKAPVAVTDFVAWWAICGVPYIGMQMMGAAAPINLRGDGSDSAAVLGGYLGISLVPRVAISLAGSVIYMASGFWLGAAVSQRTGSAPPRLTLKQHLHDLAAWRLVVASVVGLLLIAITVRSAALLDNGNRQGLLLLLLTTLLWGAMMALLVRWRAPGARNVRDHWVIPGLLASAVLITIGWLDNDDFIIDGISLVLPLIATAWIQSTEAFGTVTSEV